MSVKAIDEGYSTQDANDYETSGIFFIIDSSPINFPTTSSWGFLFVFTSHGYVLQLWSPDNKDEIYFRRR